MDRGAGNVTRSADDVFDRFGFVPTSFGEQRRIEDALAAAGVRVEPLDPSGRQVRLLRVGDPPQPPSTPAAVTPPPPPPLSAAPDTESGGRWTGLAMVLVVVLALGGAGGGIKYVHDQAAEHHRKQAASQRQLDRGADTAGRAPAPAGAIP